MHGVRHHQRVLQPVAWEIVVGVFISPVHPRVGGRFGSEPRFWYRRRVHNMPDTLETWDFTELWPRLDGIRRRVRDEPADNAVVLPYVVSMSTHRDVGHQPGISLFSPVERRTFVSLLLWLIQFSCSLPRLDGTLLTRLYMHSSGVYIQTSRYNKPSPYRIRLSSEIMRCEGMQPCTPYAAFTASLFGPFKSRLFPSNYKRPYILYVFVKS